MEEDEDEEGENDEEVEDGEVLEEEWRTEIGRGGAARQKRINDGR